MIRYLTIVLTAVALGCAADKPAATTQKSDCCAECLVCKYNADLACIDVTVKPDTPSYTYDGTPYYFCSNSCRDEFAENPSKYLPKGTHGLGH